MNSKRFLLLLGIFSLLLGIFSLLMGIAPAQAQSLPTVEVWVSVRAADTQEVVSDAHVENTLCAALPADSCTAVGAYDADKQAYVMTVPRLEAYELVIQRTGYRTEVRQGTGLDPVSVLVVFLVPQEGAPRLSKRVFLPLIISSGTPLPPQPYNPTAAVNRLNWWRMKAAVSAVQGDLELHSNCRAHARYMAQNAILSHAEDGTLPNYTLEGDFCGQAGVVSLGVEVYPSDEQMVDAMMASPFHALNLLDPRLVEVGFGSYRHVDMFGGVVSGAAIDVFHGLDYAQSIPPYITFPFNGMNLPVLSYNGLAQPDPLTSCPGYTAPTGQALFILFGNEGEQGQVQVTRTSLMDGNTPVAHCVITSSTYVHPNLDLQMQGRTALYERGAVMVIPRNPLTPGHVYSLDVDLSDQRGYGMVVITGDRLITPDLQVLRPDAD